MTKSTLLVALVLSTFTSPAEALACVFVENGPICGGETFEMPLAMCAEWVVIDGGEALGFSLCSGEGAATGGPSVPGPDVVHAAPVASLALELDGLVVTGTLSGTKQVLGRPLVYDLPGKGLMLVRDWDAKSELYRWRREAKAGADKGRRAALLVLDEKGRVTERRTLTGCRPTSWTLQASSTDTMVEVTGLTCDPARRAR